MEVRVIPRKFLAIPRSPFLEKGGMQPFVHLSIMFWLNTALQYQSNRLSNFLVFHTSSGISSSLAVFLCLICVCTTLSSPWINFPSLMSSWLLIFMIGLWGAFNKFPEFFVQAFKIVVDSSKFSILLLYILWDAWPIFMISGSNE